VLSKSVLKELSLPDDLMRFLSKSQLMTLQGYIANCSYKELVSHLQIKKRKRAQVIESLLDLGRALTLYHLLECKVTPEVEGTHGQLYYKGFNDCKKLIRKMVLDVKFKR